MIRRRSFWTAVALCSGCMAVFFLTHVNRQSTATAQGYRFSSTDRGYNGVSDTDGPLVASGNRLARVIKLVTPSVVHIQSVHGGATGGRVEETGSGVILPIGAATDLYVVTNRHVVADAQREDISIHLHDGRVIQPQKIWTDAPTDVAVLKVTGANLQGLRWGDSSQLEIGHFVLAVGSPFGLSQSSTLGIISAKGRRALNLGGDSTVLNQDFLQTDAAINPGNSGGPLIDLNGNVIAINTAIASNSGGNDGIGFSIPINLVKQVATQMVKYGRVRRAYLGVKLDPEFDVQKARRLSLDRLRGARVIEVHKDTPAARARLQVDDVILKFEGADVQDENHLINLVSLTPISSRVRMSVMRNGRMQDVDVLLIDRDAYDRRSEVPAQTRNGQRIRPQGLTLHALDGQIGQQIGFTQNDSGLVVLSIDRKHPLADQLQIYDVITEAGRQPIGSVADWDAFLQANPAGTIVLRVQRPQPKTAAATPTDRLIVWER